MKQLWMLAAILAVATVYFWTATEGTGRLGSPGGNADLLYRQVEAFHAGQVALLTPPDPALGRAANPYDPAFNRPYRLLDASYFRGRYYTYFGPAPLVLWLWPYYAASGHQAPADLTVLIFGLGAFLFQAALLALAQRRRWPACPGWALGLAVAAVGLTNFIPPLLRVHSTFEIPILSELCFGGGCLYFMLCGLWGAPGRLRPWLAASLCFGLAVLSRADFLPVGLVLLAAFAWSRRAGGAFPRARDWLGLIAPAAACLLAQAAYNVARFGRPFDFGNGYTLVEVDWRHRAAFSPRYFGANLYYYLLSVPRLGRFFPYFLESARLPSFAPSAYLGYVERVAGILPAYPFLLLGACAGFEAGAALLASAAAVALPILFFVGSSVRYQAEFGCPLALLAGFGLVAIAARGAGWGRRGLLAAAAGMAAWSAGCQFFVTSASDGYFASVSPGQFRAVAAVCDGCAYPLERFLGWRPRVPRLVLRFPADRMGSDEPLWVGGAVPSADFLYLNYAGPGFIRIGYEAMGLGGPVSGDIPVDYGQVHRLDIVAQPFLPPLGHPFYRRAGLGEGEAAMGLLRIWLDGALVVDRHVSFHDERGLDAWGRSDEEGAFGRRFTGQPFSLSWVPVDPRTLR